MAKGNRGGSRGRGGGGGGLNPSDIISQNDMGSYLAEGDKREEARQVFSVSNDMQQEYGADVAIYGFDTAVLKPKAAGTIAFYDGQNIAINQSYFDINRVDKAYADCVKNGFHPSNGNKTAMQAVAAHEYGHALTDFAANKMGIKGIGALDQAANKIVNEARKLTSHRGVVIMSRKISEYATYSNAEAVAEAVSDVYCNGSKAHAESRAIVSVLNGYLKKK